MSFSDAQQLAVTFQDRTIAPARLVGRDPDNDLAIIRVEPDATDEEGNPSSGVPRPASLGDSDRVTIGETVVAIGSPLGLQHTVTQGILSARRHRARRTKPRAAWRTRLPIG